MRKIAVIAALFLAVSSLSPRAQAMPADFSQLQQIVREFKPGKAETDAGAVIIKSEIEVDYKGDDLSTTTSYFAISILDEKAARDYTQIEQYFNSHYSLLELDFARLIDADGNEYSVSEDAVQIKSNAEGLYYSDIKYLVFSLASMRPGSTFEFQVTETIIKKPLEKGWYDFYWFYNPQSLQSGHVRVDPVRDFSLTLKYPKGVRMYHKTANSDLKPAHAVRDGFEYLTWKKRGLEKIEIEPSMPPVSNYIPAVRFSTLKDWAELEKAVTPLYLGSAELTPQLRELAQGIVKGLESDIEKVRAIFYFMQDNVRYISADFKRGGIIPHKAAEVYSNRYGDCKDQAVLMVALLSAAGVTAYPALTGFDPSSDVDPGIPSLHFSHMVVYARLGTEDLWIDVSGPPGLFPGVDWAMQGRYAFVLDGNGGSLKRVPFDLPDQSMVEVHADFRLKDEQLVADLGISMRGVMANRFKSWQLNNPQVRDDMTKIVSRFYPSAVVESLQLPDEKAQAAYHVKAKMKFPDYWKKDKDVLSVGGGLASMLGEFSNLNNLLPGKRANDFLAGSPMTFKFTASLSPPGPDYVPVVSGVGYEKENEFFRAQSGVSTAAGKNQAESLFILKKKIVPAAAYSVFVSDIDDVTKNSIWFLTYKLDKRLAGKQQMQNTLEKNPGDVVNLARLIRLHLESGEYQQAKALADKATASHPKNGEIRYLLGVALGFLGDYEKSGQLINESRKLGFKP